MSFFKKKTEDEQFADAVDETEFVPYACHWDPHTIVTRNGELMQTITIVGFEYEDVETHQAPDLRGAVRDAIFASLKGNRFALWIHTIRRRKNLDPGGEYPDPFSHALHDAWKKRNHWNQQFINELYITIVREGEGGEITDAKHFLWGLWPPHEIRMREQFLEAAYHELEATVQRMLGALSSFGARRLGFYEKDGVFYSEPITFLGKIINLAEEPRPVPIESIHTYLPDHDYDFGFNLLESRGGTGLHYGTILTLKEYKEVSPEAMDEILQLPFEFLITQCIDFINQEKAIEDYKKVENVLRLSKDAKLAEISGLNAILKSNTGSPIDYGQHQITILLLEDSIDQLEENIRTAVRAMHSLGYVCIREDLRMEDGFWAQLPANFAFVKRLMPINTRSVGGFASLYNFPAGKAHGNPWGDAVTLLHTAVGTPYFFNFHVGSCGHTSIIGPFGAGKTVLMNFLLSEAQKFRPRVFTFDYRHASELFIRRLGGTYLTPDPLGDAPEMALNPFQLPDTPDNRDFLVLWLESLVTTEEDVLSAEETALLSDAVRYVYTMPEGARCLAAAADSLAERHPGLAEALAPWHGEGEYAALFGDVMDTLAIHEGRVFGFAMDKILTHPETRVPTLLYLLQRIHGVLDGTPAFLVLDEAWNLLDNAYFAPRLKEMLAFWQQRNVVAILATESIERASESYISADLFRHHLPTQIYLPNVDAGSEYQEIFGLTEQQYALLEMIPEDRRFFMLKHGTDTIVAQMNLEGMDAMIAVLSASPEDVMDAEFS